MGFENGIYVNKVVFVVTGNLKLIENYASDTYPNSVFVDLELAQNKEIADFLEGYPKEWKLLYENKIDYIIIEYDM